MHLFFPGGGEEKRSRHSIVEDGGWRRSARNQLDLSLSFATVTMLRLHSWQQKCLLLCIIAITGAHAALTTGERNALGDLLRAFPALSLVQQDPSLYYLQNGNSASWPSTFDSLCSGNDGYEILGIRCENGHVRELFLYALISLHFALSST